MAEIVLQALRAMRPPFALYEADLHRMVEGRLTECGIEYRHEAVIAGGCRIDYLVGDVGVEIKKGKPRAATLVRQLAGEMGYYTLDNPSTLSVAESDPVGFVGRLDRAVIDEIQRAPQLMLALKMSIDEDRRPGRFLLTGSANILALPQIADSLADAVRGRP